MADPDAWPIEVGKTFKTFEEFDSYLSARSSHYEEKWVKGYGCRTVENANKAIKNETLHFRSSFKYALVSYRCRHGGVCKSSATQRNRRSNKTGCPCMIQLMADRKLDVLVVKKVELNHSHDPIPPSCNYYASDRKPTSKLKSLGVSCSKIVGHKAVPRQWLKETMSKCFANYDISTGDTSVIILERKKRRVLTEVEKRSKAFQELSSALDVMVCCGQTSFNQRMAAFRCLADAWRSGKNFPDDWTSSKTKRYGLPETIGSNSDSHGAEMEEEPCEPTDAGLFESDVGPIKVEFVGDCEEEEHSYSEGGPVVEIETDGDFLDTFAAANDGETQPQSFSTVAAPQQTAQGDHGYCVQLADPTVLPLGGLRLLRVIKKRSRPKGIGKTSEDYCKKAKCSKPISILPDNRNVVSDQDLCAVCGEKDVNFPGIVEWIMCNLCNSRFHRGCIFGEAKRVPSKFICVPCKKKCK